MMSIAEHRRQSASNISEVNRHHSHTQNRKYTGELSFKVGAILLITGLLAACGTSFKSDVATFHKLNGTATGKNVLLTVEDPQKAASLEFEHYANIIGQELQRIGYRIARNEAEADITALFDLAISDGREKIETRFRGSALGPVGFGCFRCGGPFFGGFGGFGGGFGGGEIVSRTVYHTELNITLTNQNGEHLFEGRAEADIRGNKLPESVPLLARSLFKDFPGKSGVTRQIVLPPKEQKALSNGGS